MGKVKTRRSMHRPHIHKRIVFTRGRRNQPFPWIWEILNSTRYKGMETHRNGDTEMETHEMKTHVDGDTQR